MHILTIASIFFEEIILLPLYTFLAAISIILSALVGTLVSIAGFLADRNQDQHENGNKNVDARATTIKKQTSSGDMGFKPGN